MGELLKEIQLISQNPSFGNILGGLEKLARAIEEVRSEPTPVIHPKIVKTTSASKDSVEENLEKPKKKRKKK